MRCSRVALSLLPAILAAAVIALGPADGQIGVAADLGPEQSSLGDTYKGTGDCQTITNWRVGDSTDGDKPSISARGESDAVNEDGTPVADAQEDQSASGGDDADEGHPAETGQDVEHTYGHYDEGDAQPSCPEGDYRGEAQVTEPANTDEDYTNQPGDAESDGGDNHQNSCVSEGPKAAENTDTNDDDAQQSDRWSESAGHDSESEEAGDSHPSYEPDASHSQNAEKGESDSGYQGYSEAYPEQQNAYTEDEEEYTYEYEYSDPAEKYGYAEGLSEQADDEVGDTSEDQADDDYGYDEGYDEGYNEGYDEGQEGESGEVQETQSGAPADSEYVDPCQPYGSQGYNGNDTLQETTDGVSDRHDGTTAEGAVWGAIVSWASRSLEELGDACHSLSRQISGLGGKPWAVGNRWDGHVN